MKKGRYIISNKRIIKTCLIKSKDTYNMQINYFYKFFWKNLRAYLKIFISEYKF